MKKLLNRIFTKRNLCILFALVVLALLAYFLTDLKSIRRDLYGVRSDYYNLGDKNEKAVENPLGYKIISQEVKKMDVYDLKADYTYNQDAQYKSKNVRVVRVEVKNNSDYLQSVDVISLGYANKNGVIVMPVSIKPSEDLNKSPAGGYAQIVPGGVAKFYTYFLDTGKEIKELYTSNSSGGV